MRTPWPLARPSGRPPGRPQRRSAQSLPRMRRPTRSGAPPIAVRAASPAPRMARQVQHLLLRFGVSSAVAGTVLTVKGEQARRLFREIGLPGWERLRSWARFDQGQLLTQPDIVWDPVA